MRTIKSLKEELNKFQDSDFVWAYEGEGQGLNIERLILPIPKDSYPGLSVGWIECDVSFGPTNDVESAEVFNA